MYADAPPQDVIDRFVAASHGDLTTVRTLLAKHPSLINASARWVETPIQAASHTGAKEVAEFLLAQGASLDICTAAMLGQIDRVRAFLELDPALCRATGAHGIPVLYHAAIRGHVGVAELLLTFGADVNQGEGGNTALHGAARFGRAEMARWLLDRGAHGNALDYEKKTPLRVAVEAGHADVADLLRRRDRTE